MLNINERYKTEKLSNQMVVDQIIMKGPFRDGGAHFKLFFLSSRLYLACELHTHFRSSLLSLRKIGGREARPEMCLLFAG